MKEQKLPVWFLMFFSFIVIMFIVGSLNKLYLLRDSVNGIRPELYKNIVINYELVEKSINEELDITLDIRNDAVGRVNNHGYQQLREEERKAVSRINGAIHNRYLIDNNLRNGEEYIQIEAKVIEYMEFLNESLLLDNQKVK